MKHCKHYLLFLLAGALLLLPVTSHYAYAISWLNFKTLKEKASELVSSETLQKIMPGALIALGIAGSLYYWWTSKKGGDDSEKGDQNLIPKDLIPRPTLKQLQVYSQKNDEGGGAASCGYHTLLRGMQVINAKARNESEKELANTLMNVNAIIYYFNFENPLGIWREQIIQRRRLVAIAELLKQKLFTAIKNDNLIENYDPKISDLYRSIINRDIKPELVAVFERGGTLGEYEFRAEDFEQLFMKTDFVPEDKQYADIIKDPNIINTYLDLNRVSHELSKMQLPTIQDSNNGDWLQGNELEFLWDEQGKLRQRGQGIISNDVHCGFTPIDDFNWIGKKSTEFFRDEEGNFKEREVDVDVIVPSIRSKLQEMAELRRNYFHIFGIGTMKQLSDTSREAGHWFALILYQHNDGNREYFITDSMDNKSRKNDANVKTLIEAIENKAVVSKEEI